MKNVTIDCFGNRNDLHPDRFANLRGEKYPHLIDEAGNGVTYIAFDRESVAAQPIHKVIESGSITTIWWGYGAWSNRASLEYTLTKNETKTVQVDD